MKHNKKAVECIEDQMSYEQYRSQWCKDPVFTVSKEFYNKAYFKYWGKYPV